MHIIFKVFSCCLSNITEISLCLSKLQLDKVVMFLRHCVDIQYDVFNVWSEVTGSANLVSRTEPKINWL